MPKQNRVTPFSTLIATSARGTLMGNRGCLHDVHGRIRRQFQGQRWIICLLDFKGRKRRVMTPGRYTELFFLDEATGLAAGHRPCAECQRTRFNYFRELWAKANLVNGNLARPAAPTIDAVLHQERTLENESRRSCYSVGDLPDGTFVTDDEHNSFLALQNSLLRWSPAGYDYVRTDGVSFPLRVVTPASVVRTLGAGYEVGIHPSALLAIAQR